MADWCRASASAAAPASPLPGCCLLADPFARGSGSLGSSSGDDITEEPTLVTRLARGGGAPFASGEAATAAAAAAAVAAAVAEDEDGVMELAGEDELDTCLGVPWMDVLEPPGVPSLLSGRITRASQPGDTCNSFLFVPRDLLHVAG